jgi:hypothetical protein
MPAGLMVAGLRQAPGEGQISAMACLGHGALIGALGAASRMPRSLSKRGILVGARADRLDEGQPAGPVQQIVAPEAGDQQHIGLADPALELCRRTQLEARDPRLARQEALLELIGHMGEADGQAVPGRQHGFSPSTSRH